jgi:hypothetical protein
VGQLRALMGDQRALYRMTNADGKRKSLDRDRPERSIADSSDR